MLFERESVAALRCLEPMVVAVCEIGRGVVGLWEPGVWGGGETKRTRTVLSTDPSLGKSETPFPSVSTEDSRRLRDVRREATQSP